MEKEAKAQVTAWLEEGHDRIASAEVPQAMRDAKIAFKKQSSMPKHEHLAETNSKVEAANDLQGVGTWAKGNCWGWEYPKRLASC
jgi:hypothetical protein